MMQRSKSLLDSAQHSHLPVLDSHFSPSYPKTHLPSPPSCLSGAGFMAEKSLHTETQSRFPQESLHNESCCKGTPCPLLSVLIPEGMKFLLKLLFICLFFIENSMDQQSISWETFATLKKIRHVPGYCKPKKLIILTENIGVYDKVFLLSKRFCECF